MPSPLSAVVDSNAALVAPLDRRSPIIAPLGKTPRRMLFFGKSMSRTRATGGLVEAFRDAGLEVEWINIAKSRRWLGKSWAMKRVRARYRRFRPDLIAVFCRDLPRPLLEEFAASTPVVMWLEEALDRIDDGYADYMHFVHAVFMTNPARLPWLYDRGIRQATFALEGFSPTWHHPAPRPQAPVRDLAFIGGPGREGIRAHFLAKIAAKRPLMIFGKGWDSWRRHYPQLDVRRPVGPSGYRRICATTKIVLGINQINDDPLYFSNRTLLTLACRGFHLTHYVPKLESVFQDGRHLAWFHDADHCLERIAHYLERSDDRARIADLGHEEVMARHQFRHRVQVILERLRTGSPSRDELTPILVDEPSSLIGRAAE
jgi:hypothetical protein